MTTATKQERYWLPTIPYSAIDLVNRRASATGSIRYAQASEHGNYNGHRVSVSFKPHAVSGPTWNAEYTWAGRRVFGRGSFARCMEAAKQYHDKGHRGAAVWIYLSDEAPESIEEQKQIAESLGASLFNDETEQAHKDTWWTDAHKAVSDALGWEKYWPGTVAIAVNFTGTFEGWPEARKAYTERHRRNR